MSSDVLTKLEKKAFSVFYRDGSFELFYGIMLFAGVLRDLLPYLGAPVLTAQIVSIGLIITACLLFTLVKYITAPRLGFVKFSKARRDRIQLLPLILTVVVIISVIGLYLTMHLRANNTLLLEGAKPPNYLGSIIITLLIFTAISLVGYFLDYPRLYGMAVLFAATEPAHFYLKHYTSLRPVGVYVNTLPAVLLIVIGIFSLRSFLRQYAIPGEEAMHE